MNLRENTKNVLNRFPDELLAIFFKQSIKISTWNFDVADKKITLLDRQSWLEAINKDDKTGKLTGVDSSGNYEKAFRDMYISKLNKNSILLDIGAASGLYSLIAAKFCLPKNIYCFEPHPIYRYILKLNNKTYYNNMLKIDNRFVGDITKDDTITMDDFCSKLNLKPTFVKMDIEGAEIFALKGMRQICCEFHPIILMEFHIRKLREQWKIDPNEVIKILKNYGYNLKFNGHHGYVAGHSGEYDKYWHDELPNNINCALLAEK